MSAEVWKPTTVATIAREFAHLSRYYAINTVGNTEGTEFQNHDFSYRDKLIQNLLLVLVLGFY